jgi:hypothetical protein
VVPFAAFGLVQAPVLGVQVPATWQTSRAVQVTGVPVLHVPARQESPVVHLLPSSQALPSDLAGLLQVPVAVSQVPAVWHWSIAVQVTGEPPMQFPAWHVSPCVQALPSLQVVPLPLAGFVHAPLEVSQVPTTWHWSRAVQVTGLLPTQAPPWQASVCVHGLLSLQVVPSGAEGLVQSPVDGLHVPARWQASAAVQVTGMPAVQAPPWQVSPVVHLSPALQGLPSEAGGFEQAPVAGSQLPTVWH